MSRTRLVLTFTVVFLTGASVYCWAEGAETNGLTVGAYINARGFLSLGFSVTHPIDRLRSVKGSFEVPILLSAVTDQVRDHRIVLSAPYQLVEAGWGVRTVPELSYVSQRNSLGRFRSIGIASDAHLGYWDEDASSSVSHAGVGGIVGIEWIPITWIAPSEYLQARFTGIPEGEVPSRGARFSTRLGWRLGGFGEWYEENGAGVAASIGLRGHPNRLDAFGKGFPYGELPFFLEIEGNTPYFFDDR